MPTQAFDVQRGTDTIAGSSGTDTITAGSEYTAPAAATSAFIRLSNARKSGMGDTAGGGGQAHNDFSTWITNPGNITTSITVNRSDSADADANRYSWEIIEYVGSGGGANEFIVRHTELLTCDDLDTTKTSSTFTGVSDVNDCVVFITSQATDSGLQGDSWRFLWYPTGAVTDAGGGNFTAEIGRLGGTAGNWNAFVSIAVVEFTGSNWSVDHWSSDTTGTTWSTGNSNTFTIAHGVTVADATKAFLVGYYATDNDATGVDDTGDAMMLSGTSNVILFNNVTTGSRRKAGFIVQNSQADGTARNLKVQHHSWADDSINGGTEERSFTETGFTAVADITESSVFLTTSMNGSGTGIPRGWIDHRLTGTGTLTLTESDDGGERRFMAEIVEWPEDPDAGGATPILVSLIT